MTKFRITANLTRNVWHKLETGDVPGTAVYTWSELTEWVQQANKDIASHSYLPAVVHGYLGIEKNFGVTRFIPILSKEDMSVYYHLCGSIGNVVIKNVENIFGGWRSIPFHSPRPFSRRQEVRATESQQNYYSSPFSSAAWFQQFQNFNEVIRSLVSSGVVGNYVVKTDIANFYDSIDVGRLIRRLRQDAPELSEEVNLLEIFLGYWNRRTSGYQVSSRGIPQEIISDGSRNLSHYYLQDFDEKFIAYSASYNLCYVRWADDILIFGNSTKSLEKAIHAASQFLLADGLNLNASKTQVFSRRDFEWYRGLRLLDAIDKRNRPDFQSELRSVYRNRNTKPLKLDTVFRASIGFASLSKSKPGSTEHTILFNILREKPEFIGSLNSPQLFKLIKLAADPEATLAYVVRTVAAREYTAPKATILTLIRSTGADLQKLGIKRSQLFGSIREIERSSASSEMLNHFCIPGALSALTP